jgi:lipopolysaccharide transport system permease protein
MAKVVYTSSSREPLARLVNPLAIVANLLRHRELILAYARREYHAAHRDTFFGLAWAALNPLIMLTLFTFVFGYVFHGRFTTNPDESAADYALALFVGLTLFNLVAQTLGQGPGLLLANSVYVKTLSFPIEILSVAQILNLLLNAVIGLGLCLIGFVTIHGYINWTAIWLVAHLLCLAVLCVGLSWFLSSLAVFFRDLPSITTPLNMILMFLSSVFFSIESVPHGVAWLFRVNPIAIIVDQGRAALLYGRAPDLPSLALVFLLSLLVAVAGHAFFQRTQAAFADVI